MGSFKHFKTTEQRGRQPGKITAPLSEKLKNVTWGEYNIGNLFKKLELKFIKSNFDKANDISKEQTLEFDVPLVNAKNGNNGIMYYGRSKDFESAEMTIDIVNDGAISTGNVYSQPQRTGVLYNAYLIKSKVTVSKSILHFLTVAIYKSIKHKFGYENKAGWEKVRKEKIKLPTRNGKIDFDFMESFIAELEAERIVELEAYLLATGLNDYTLTEEEQKALDEFENLEWANFNLEDLFGKSTRGKRLKSADRIKGSLPFVTAGEADEGISDYIANDVEIFPNNTITIDMFGSAKYRNYKYGGDDHIAVVHTDKLPKFAAIFTTTAIHKSSHTSKFSYSRNFYAKDADELDIILPAQNNQPNYKIMEIFISAIQKLIIRDVVLYSERKIDATKEAIK